MNDEFEQPPVPGRERWSGTIMLFLSTICYGVSNTTLRLLTEYKVDNDWILFYKELIGLALLLPWLLLRFRQSRYRLISKRLILFVAAAAVLCELVGARLHVLGFAVIGLVIAVPLVQSATLLGTAFLGRYFLGDPLSRQRKIAIAVLIAAVVLLSIGKEMLAVQAPEAPATRGETILAVLDASNEPVAKAPEQNMGLFLLVAAGTIVAGLAYSVYIVMIRYAVRKYWKDASSVWLSFQFTQWAGYDYPTRRPDVQTKVYAPFPVTLTMSIVLTVGVLVFGSCLLGKYGLRGFVEAPEAAWHLVPISGVCNLVGFFFQVQGLRMTTAVQASLIAVSQILVLSLIGLVFFSEPINLLVGFGLLLATCGVLMSARPEKSRQA